MKNMRFQCDVMEPPPTTDDNGQPIGKPTAVMRGIPCSIEQLSGREGEIAHQTRGFAVTRVKFHGDPRKPIKPHYFLQVGDKRLEISDINDVRRNGEEYELLCGEVT